jgi:ABC-type transporter Mla maintaining outer membrane lipid asymmetry ATPase subunit MlaF
MSHPNTPFGGPTPTFAQSVDVGVSWSGIKYTVGEREILKGLSGNALPRRSLAIMGSSGAGKTTFLNALSDRLASNGKNIKLEGKRFLNDVEYERPLRRSCSRCACAAGWASRRRRRRWRR